MTVDVQTENRGDRPTQAVILAGGRGTRMQPLTSTRPKPMIEFHGKPFLEYLIDLLREQGFDRVLLLLGYLPEVIQNHFGDGSRWGVRIDYSVSDPDELTATRVKRVVNDLDPCFLLMYCDNYWPLQMDRMWERYTAMDVPAMVTVYGNEDRVSKDNILVDDDGYVRVFDRGRKTPGLRGNEISYALLTKNAVVECLPDHDELFEEAVYPTLAARGQLAAYVTQHRYYSVGSLERLPVTDTFLARHPTIILDRDGVLNRKLPRAEYVRRWEEFAWLPGAKQALRLLNTAGYRVIVVSNQAGIARGAMSEEDLAAVHERMTAEVVQAGGRIDAIYHCPHGWDDGCDCRKPQPGMLLQAQRDFHLDLSRTLFIGDDERDGQAADAAGCTFARVTEQTSLLDVVRATLGAAYGKEVA